ncbi:hypothetical protein EW093_06715 [Thiospirochaeta perfilievii]|uniref:PPM-type phosphatase domain-containing protein n=1 Tax=Thiospirochaeta perfilievii TaxID=252967 RepID=A0A5C1QBG5_9SPIO|nr:SpoIIE family protein phosphatase [Thiospirochaeta perfilievii]QEN04400.1 hypothetical protein EW093_06715 [Thiospirochaeta perfilievii]
MKIKLSFIYILLFISFNLQSQEFKKNNIDVVSFNNKEEGVNLSRNWLFIPDDNLMYKDKINNINDWYNCNIVGAWYLQVPEAKNYTGTGWFKLYMDIDPSVASEHLGLFLPFSYGGYSVYLNGQFLYESENKFGTKAVSVDIPKELIKAGVNDISVRVKSFSGWGGFSGMPHLGTYNFVYKFFISFIIRNVGISFISLFLSLFFIFHYLFRRQDTFNLVFAGLCFSVALFIMGFNGLWFYIFNYPWAYWVLTFIGGILMYLLPILFFHAFYNMKIRLVGKIFTVFYLFLAAFVLIEFFITGQLFIFNRSLYMLFQLSYILVVIYLFAISIGTLRKRLMYSKLLFLSIFLLGLTFIYSMLCFSTIIYKDPLIGEGFFLMAAVFSIVLAKRFANTHENLEVEYEKNLDLNRTLEDRVFVRTLELKEKNRMVMDSIEYASKIQNSMLPNKYTMAEYLSDFYTIWKPKNVVGGDSYWFYKHDKGFLIAVIDCTGHGVPGAILSTTANNVLERIVSHINNSDPATILYELNRILKRILSQDNPFDIADDGLDIGLCYYDINSSKLTFAGSKIRLHTVDANGELTEYKGDRQGIGYKRSKIDYNYTNHEINVDPSTSFYMTTDGYLDQNGGDQDFGLGWTRYLNLIKSGYKLDMDKQKINLDTFFDDYRGLAEQRDDITLIGFKIKEKAEVDKND